jgi:SAM-dependent methyltransferase/predicted metal-dependent enzyme (double-stranded beta helix superfamily)
LPFQPLPNSIQFIINRLVEKDTFSSAEVRTIVLEAQVTAKDLLPWADFDHPLADSYGRQLVFQGPHFEIMVMSWAPGDFSGIHDHGFTSWGAVQVFGAAEHATFRVEGEELITLARWNMDSGDVIGVNHQLIHQMGNPTKNENFLSLHVYGTPENQENITGDARVFALEHPVIQRVDGGVFFALPEEDVKRTEKSPKPDFTTYIRYMVELGKRMSRMRHSNFESTRKKIFDLAHHSTLLEKLYEIVDEKGHIRNSIQWKILVRELKAVAAFQEDNRVYSSESDPFNKYAEVYDALIGQPCLTSFIAQYLKYFFEQHSIETVLSIGSGTGLSESFIIENLGVKKENLLGIDISESMVSVAQNRIHAIHADLLQWNSNQQFDLAYSGLNVFHYMPYQEMENAVNKTAELVKNGGWFIGDFITPDHIRWYPNLMVSGDSKVISLRTPSLIEEHGRMFQESEIINISFQGDEMDVHYAGTHKRFLPPLHRIRKYFEKAFGGEVQLLDAASLEPIAKASDSCSSTRYVVIAQKKDSYS